MPESDKKISRPLADFLKVFLEKTAGEAEMAEKAKETEPGAEEAGESIALFYEKVRRLIEYKDDHLIKRSAIERILKRNLIIEWRQSDFAGQFINELVMTGYLTREQISKETRARIRAVIEKYQNLFKEIYNIEIRRWLVSMASCEVEEILFPQPVKKALVSALFQTVEGKIAVEQNRNIAGPDRFVKPNQSRSVLSEADRKIQIYLASLKSLMKVDNISLKYVLFKIYLSEWFQEKAKTRPFSSKEIMAIKKNIDAKISSPLIFKISAAIKKTALYFNILYETILRNAGKAESIVNDPEALVFAVQLTCDDIYDREMKKFKKRVRRSLAFLVITKVLLAVFLEYPYAKYFLGNVLWLPIFANLLFPPFLLVFLSATVPKPGAKNSEVIAEGVKNLVYGDEKGEKVILVKAREEKTFSEIFLNIFFFLTFGLSFGLVIWALNFLKFDFPAIIIFLFLVSVVSFFSALVRQPIRDLVVLREREGIFITLLDTLFLPFVRIGKWMSENFSKVNIFLFIFDVFIEAPFKVFVRFIQDWAGFIRRKKEEMV